MIEVEEFVRQYFIDNGIPLKLKYGQSTVIMAVYGAKIAKCCNDTPGRFAKRWFPSKPKMIRIYTYILSLNNLKYCKVCDRILNKSMFHKLKTQSDGLRSRCKNCQKKYTKTYNQYPKTKLLNKIKSANRRATIINRTPVWADEEKIKEIYLKCPGGYHVDHIIPLQGEYISGLHIETNLQYITKRDNSRKGNKWPFNDYLDPIIIPE